RRVQGKGPRVLLFAGQPGDFQALRAALGTRGPPVLFGGDEGSLRALQAEDDTNDNVYFASAFAADADLPRVREFVTKYQKAHGEEPAAYAARGHDGTRLLAEAMRRAEGTDPARVREELAGLKDFKGLTGPLSFDEDRRAKRAVFVLHLRDG